MKIINAYMKYVYIALITALLITLIAFFVRLSKTMKKIAETGEGVSTLSSDLDQTNEKLSAISDSKDSYKFFLSLFAIILIVKETFKYYKSERSLPKSFTKAVLRHNAQISGFRF